MKKLLAVLLCMALVFAFAACGDDKDESKAPESTASDASVDASTDASEDASADASEDASTDASEEASADASEDASADASEDASADASEETSTGDLTAEDVLNIIKELPAVKLMESGKYSLTTSMLGIEIVMYADGDKQATIAMGEKTIVKDGFSYSLDDDEKTYIKMEADETDDLTSDILDLTLEYTLVSAEKKTVNGVEATVYMLQATVDDEDVNLGFAVANGDLVALIASESGISIEMPIAITTEVPEGVFDIPEDYTETTYDFEIEFEEDDEADEF